MSIITTRHMRAHYVSMARYCNRAVVKYLRRADTPLFPAAARHNAAWATTYRDLRDEYMERARYVAALD